MRLRTRHCPTLCRTNACASLAKLSKPSNFTVHVLLTTPGISNWIVLHHRARVAGGFQKLHNDVINEILAPVLPVKNHNFFHIVDALEINFPPRTSSQAVWDKLRFLSTACNSCHQACICRDLAKFHLQTEGLPEVFRGMVRKNSIAEVQQCQH